MMVLVWGLAAGEGFFPRTRVRRVSMALGFAVSGSFSISSIILRRLARASGVGGLAVHDGVGLGFGGGRGFFPQDAREEGFDGFGFCGFGILFHFFDHLEAVGAGF